MATVEDESFMIACLKMAKAYIKIARDEIWLYHSKPDHEIGLQAFDLTSINMLLDKLIPVHQVRLEQARNPAPKWKDPAACPECGGTPKTGHTMFCSVFVEEKKKTKVKLKQRAPEPEKVVSTNKIPARKSGLRKRMV